jgi:hypothetical protein
MLTRRRTCYFLPNRSLRATSSSSNYPSRQAILNGNRGNIDTVTVSRSLAIIARALRVISSTIALRRLSANKSGTALSRAAWLWDPLRSPCRQGIAPSPGGQLRAVTNVRKGLSSSRIESSWFISVGPRTSPRNLALVLRRSCWLEANRKRLTYPKSW